MASIKIQAANFKARVNGLLGDAKKAQLEAKASGNVTGAYELAEAARAIEEACNKALKGLERVDRYFK